MVLKLDLKDRRILRELDADSRQPSAEIARKVGLSKQVVGFRIKRLAGAGVFSSLYTVIDISKLGFTVHKAFLRFQNLDKRKESELVKYLKGSPNVVWMTSCDGRYDLAFGSWARNMAHLDQTLGEFTRKFGQYISERQIASIIQGEYFVRDYLVGGERPATRKSFFGAVPQAADVDETDWKILFELGKSSRIFDVELAGRVGIGAEAVSKRIRRLERAGVIRHYNIVPNESVYPYLHYKVLVGLRGLTEVRERALAEYCRSHPNIVYTVKALGPWEYEIDLEVETAEAFRDIMMDLKTRFNDILKDYSALQIYQVHKYDFCPSIQFGT
ncbi:hypothetical protein AUJ14_04635 [Candidatus Micrarchaeota archaeon CG1_02_55_22]|nr:MAG: hypothetical protein AUJ14_04635 [Candidatus Micrarchaeota archaeon CG1_02_55_22]